MKEKLLIGLLIIISFITVLFFGYRKVNYHVDEVWTFGLANHVGSISPDIEYGKEYSGTGFYDDFMQVHSGQEFNYANVLNNQANDVHPPLYYFFIHTVCSIFKDSYSMWYGIAVNIFWMIPTIILLYHFIKELTGDILKTFGFVLVYITSMAVIDVYVFLRMYAQFVFFAIAIAYLIKKYWDRTLDKWFYILFSLITILGLLSHYYFLIFAFFISAAYGVHLIIEKRFKELRNCVITAVADGALYLAMWPYIIDHIFKGGRGHQAIHSAFSIGGIVVGIILVAICVRIYKRGKEKYTYLTALKLTGLFYAIVVLKIAPYLSPRYSSPVIFIAWLMIFDAVYKRLERSPKNGRAVQLTIGILMFINIAIYTVWGFHVPNDYYSKSTVKLFEYMEGKKVIVYLRDDWEALCYFVPMQKAASYTFINDENMVLLDNAGKGDVIITIGEYGDTIEQRIGVKPIHGKFSNYRCYEVL